MRIEFGFSTSRSVYKMLFLLASFALSWGGKTHKSVTKSALALLKADKPAAYKFFTTTHSKYMDTFHTGTTDPDQVETGAGQHYYNYPGKGENTGQYYKGGSKTSTPKITARTRLEDHLDKAHKKYCKKEYSKAFRELGRAIHYIEDIGCPPHASDIQYTSKGTNHHKKFESYVNSVCGDFKVKTNPKVYEYFRDKELGWILNNLAKKSYKYKADVKSKSNSKYKSAGKKAYNVTAHYVSAFLNNFYESRDCT